MSVIDHILLFTFLFGLFVIWGIYNYNTKDSKQFWISALLPIIAFALITGMRYGWGVDYPWYKYQFENAFSTTDARIEEQDRLFVLFNQLLNLLGFNYVGAFITYSLIFIICAFIFVKSFKSTSKYMYALLVPACMMTITWTIRQGFSFSFVFLALYFLHKKKWFGLVISVLICGLLHKANFIIIAIIAIFYIFLEKKLFNWKITIPLLIFFVFFFDVSSIGIISNYINTLSFGESKFQAYVDNSDQWFSEDAVRDEFKQGIFARLLQTTFYCGIIYLGYKAIVLRKNKQIVYLYNTMVFGIIAYQAVFYFELLRRITTPLICFYFIILGYSIHVLFNKKYLLKNRKVFAEINDNNKTAINNNDSIVKRIAPTRSLKNKKRNDPLICKIVLGVILLYLFLFWGRWILFNNLTGFIWN